MFDPLQLLKPSYLFNVRPGNSFESYLYLMIFFAILLVIAIVIFVFLRVKKVDPPLKKLLRPIPIRLEVFALLGILLVLFRLSDAYYLSMRFFLVVWFAAFIWYLVILSKKIRRYPSELKDFIEREEAKKYIFQPSKKKR